MKRQAAIALVAVGVLASAATATAERRIASKTASGKRANAVATGSADNPKALYASVTAKPRQKFTANWTVICTRGSDAGSKNGKFAAKAPYRKRLRLSVSRPENCTVIVNARLAKSGRVTVTLLAD
jgi:hypothetical protein